ncbi:hypothetical protein KIN20_033342 [Parelaphostrongylus tenuis]|uniref:Uncharacterized protein n=1 Tax=Parelaphostrongylus tenuis TaxID=148309 RepID=A0AAD5WIB5_PARTN|nr:hypothetical protein KIN20_033342 [Parelaphostrongylus tenuis]
MQSSAAHLSDESLNSESSPPVRANLDNEVSLNNTGILIGSLFSHYEGTSKKSISFTAEELFTGESNHSKAGTWGYSPMSRVFEKDFFVVATGGNSCLADAHISRRTKLFLWTINSHR